MMERPEGARCAEPDVDPEWFFPDPPLPCVAHAEPKQYCVLCRIVLARAESVALALATCELCPVQAACYEASMSFGPSLDGIWAGKDHVDRRNDRKVIAKAKIHAMIEERGVTA